LNGSSKEVQSGLRYNPVKFMGKEQNKVSNKNMNSEDEDGVIHYDN